MKNVVSQVSVVNYLTKKIKEGDSPKNLAAKDISKYDKDGSGKIDLDEFQAIWADRAKTTAAPGASTTIDAIVRFVFAKYDKDKSGYIGLGELRTIMLDLGLEIDAGALTNEFVTLDADGSGKVSLEEFATWWSTRMSQMMSANGAPDSTFDATVKFVFTQYDKDGSGQMDSSELMSVLADIAMDELRTIVTAAVEAERAQDFEKLFEQWLALTRVHTTAPAVVSSLHTHTYTQAHNQGPSILNY